MQVQITAGGAGAEPAVEHSQACVGQQRYLRAEEDFGCLHTLHLIRTFCKATTYLASRSFNVFAEITSLLDVLFQRFYLDTTGIYNTEQLQSKPSPVMKVQLFSSVCCSACPPSTISQVETALLSCKNKEMCYSHQPGSRRDPCSWLQPVQEAL